MKQQKPAYTGVKLLAILMTLAGASQLFTGCGGKSYRDELVMAAAELNKQYPAMIDSFTRIDSIHVGEGEEMQYYNTFILADIANVDTQQLAATLTPTLLESVKTNLQAKQYRDKGVTFTYIYSDKNGNQLFRRTFTKDDYKK